MLDKSKLYELKKDISSPRGYWRAGIRKTLTDWETDMGGEISDWSANEWFYRVEELEAQEKETGKDIIENLTNEIFSHLGLHSISYKEAANAVTLQALERYTDWLNQEGILKNDNPDFLVREEYKNHLVSQFIADKWGKKWAPADLIDMYEAIKFTRWIDKNFSEVEHRVFELNSDSEETRYSISQMYQDWLECKKILEENNG